MGFRIWVTGCPVVRREGHVPEHRIRQRELHSHLRMLAPSPVYMGDNTLQRRFCLDVRQSEPLSSVHLRRYENQCTVSTDGPCLREGLARVHIAALLTQVTDARFNPRARFSRDDLNSGSELVARMNAAVRPGKRGRGLSRLFRLDGVNELVTRRSLAFCLVKHDGGFSRRFRFHSGNELVAKINHVVCAGKRGGIATGLFHLNGGSEFVARMGLAVRFVKHDGRASRLFPINGSLGSGRVRCFRASLTLAALHNYTILSQRLDTELSAAPESAPTGKVDKIFLAGRA